MNHPVEPLHVAPSMAAQGGGNRGVLLALFALSLAPVLLSTALFLLSPPSGGQSYGQLLPTQSFAAARDAHWPRGRWVLAATAEPGCPAACRERFFTMRQIHTAQGEDARRMTRVALLPDGNTAADAPVGLPSRAALPAGAQGIYLIDPLGNQVLFYPDGAEPERVLKEVAKVMKTNNGLG